jgi:hypothetical protein
MKKTIATLSIALAAIGAQAGNFVSLDVEHVMSDSGGAPGQAQYLRAGKDVSGLNLGLQVRTSALDGGGLSNSIEGTVGKNFGPINMFGGLAHDNGLNGSGSYQYGVVGASISAPVGPFTSYAGVKTRVNWEDSNPSQTAVFAGLSYPLTKSVSVNVNASKSYRDIQETAYGVGIRVGF